MPPRRSIARSMPDWWNRCWPSWPKGLSLGSCKSPAWHAIFKLWPWSMTVAWSSEAAGLTWTETAPNCAPSWPLSSDGGHRMSLQEECDVLRRVPMFQAMEESQLKLLSFASERVNFMPGETFLRQGDMGDNAYV